MTDSPPPQDFLVWLASQSEGRTATELTDGLAELVRRVKDTGKKGSISLTVAVRALSAQPPVSLAAARNFQTPADFAGYINRHKGEQTEIYADAIGGTDIVAVLDSAGPGADPGRGHHRATLTLRKTRDWTDWLEGDRKLFGQAEFGEFIEDHAPNVVTPGAAAMMEMAMTFRAKSSAAVESTKRLKSGETTFLYSKAGTKGTFAIPDSIGLRVQIYEGGDFADVTARFRYRLHDGVLRFAYALRTGEAMRQQFLAIAEAISQETETSVWAGKP